MAQKSHVILPFELGRLVMYAKPAVVNLGFKMDRDFKLDSQIIATVEFLSFKTIDKN